MAAFAKSIFLIPPGDGDSFEDIYVEIALRCLIANPKNAR